MYMVVSRWDVNPGQEEEVETRAAKVRETLSATPGVTLMQGFSTEDGKGIIAVIGYESKDTYDRIINDPEGPFQRALAENRLEDYTHWVWSERGETHPEFASV
jgi:heme-degrading monooxygenase HmoA